MADPEVGAPGNSDDPLSPTPDRVTFSLKAAQRLATAFAHAATSLAQEGGIHPRILVYASTETQLSLQGPKQGVVVDTDVVALFGAEGNGTLKTYVPISLSPYFRLIQVSSTATFDDSRTQPWSRR